jgi:hypothetical protein
MHAVGGGDYWELQSNGLLYNPAVRRLTQRGYRSQKCQDEMEACTPTGPDPIVRTGPHEVTTVRQGVRGRNPHSRCVANPTL